MSDGPRLHMYAPLVTEVVITIEVSSGCTKSSMMDKALKSATQRIQIAFHKLGTKSRDCTVTIKNAYPCRGGL